MEPKKKVKRKIIFQATVFGFKMLIFPGCNPKARRDATLKEALAVVTGLAA